MPYKKIKSAIENYTPSNNRSQIVEKATNKFLLDAYNANPTSMAKALESFASYSEEKKVAVLGDMLELGEFSAQAHQQMIKLANKLNIKVITVGNEFGKIQPTDIQHFAHTDSLKKWFWQQDFVDTFFLLKGSRGIGLEKLLQ